MFERVSNISLMNKSSANSNKNHKTNLPQEEKEERKHFILTLLTSFLFIQVN